MHIQNANYTLYLIAFRIFFALQSLSGWCCSILNIRPGGEMLNPTITRPEMRGK